MEKIIAIVFDCNKRPFSVVMDNGRIYDVEYCKADDTLYYSSCGNYGIDKDGVTVHLEAGEHSDYWLAKRFRPNVGSGNRLRHINPKWLRGLGSWGSESRTVYCKICKDNFPTDYIAGDPCKHVRWDKRTGWWAGKGMTIKQGLFGLAPPKNKEGK